VRRRQHLQDVQLAGTQLIHRDGRRRGGFRLLAGEPAFRGLEAFVEDAQLGDSLERQAIVAFAVALFLARDRRRTTLSAGVCLIIAGTAILAVRKLAGTWVVDSLADAPNAQAVADDPWSIGSSLMVSVAQGGMLLGLIVVVGAWLAGPGRRATQARNAAAPIFRQHPAVVRAGLALLLLILWGPVPWTGQVVPLLLLTAAAFVWLELLMKRTVADLGAVPATD
jgi:hypothetical protein